MEKLRTQFQEEQQHRASKLSKKPTFGDKKPPQ